MTQWDPVDRYLFFCRGSSFSSKVFQLLVAAAVFYGIYKCFCSGQRRMHQGYSASASSGTGVGGGIGGTGGTGGTGGGFWTGQFLLAISHINVP